MANCCTGLCSMTFFLLLIATGLSVAALATDNWLKTSTGSIGLWNYCAGGNCDSYYNLTDDPDWLNAVRGLLILSMMGFLGVSIFYSCFCCCDSCGRKCMISIQVVFMWGAAAAVIAATVVFVQNWKNYRVTAAYSNYDWSFYLSGAGGGVFVLAGLLGLIDICATK